MSTSCLQLLRASSQYLSRAADGGRWNLADGVNQTLRVRFRLHDLAQHAILYGVIDGSTGWELLYDHTDGHLYLYTWSLGGGGASDIQLSPTFGAANTWYDLFVTYSAARQVHPWVDGTASGATALGGSIGTNAALALMVGRDGPPATILGNLDVAEISKWDRLLADYEIQDLSGNTSTGKQANSSLKYPPTIRGHWKAQADGTEDSGAAGGPYPFTLQNSPASIDSGTSVFGSGGTTPLTLSSAVYAGGQVTLTFDRAVLDSAVCRTGSNYAITPPGGQPAVTVSAAVPSGSTVVLTLSGSIYNGGSYSVAIASADVVRASADEGGNAAGASAAFTIPATQLAVSSVVAESATSLLVTYNRPVQQTSPVLSGDALNPANYAIAPPGPTVLSVASVTALSVRLTTSSESPGSYTLTVSNVQDTNGGVI